MEDKKSFLISIIIPTKNRQEFAIQTVRQILLSPELDVQVVIQDNSDDNRLFKMLEEYKNDGRLKYNYSPKVLSFVDNFSCAVENSDGEYICIIGDDDGINYEIFEMVRWAKMNNIDAIKPATNNVYIWPNTGISNSNSKLDSGYLMINKITSSVSIDETKKDLMKLMQNGCQKYLTLNLVKLYHGVVKRSKMEEVKNITGHYFGGLSPDIYSAVSLSIVISRILCIDYPLTISGVCKKSGSADSVTGKHTGNYEDAPHLVGHDNYEWSSEVPKFYSVETIWADSSLAAVRNMNEMYLINHFREESLVAYCINKYSNYSDLVKKHYFIRMSKFNISEFKAKFLLFKSLVFGPGLDFIQRVINKLSRRKGDLVKLYDVKDIVQAQNELMSFLKSNNLSIQRVIRKIEDDLNKGQYKNEG